MNPPRSRPAPAPLSALLRLVPALLVALVAVRRCARANPRPRRLRSAAVAAPPRGRRLGADLALGPQGLRAGALAVAADPHRAQGPGQPELGRLGLPGLARRPHPHQLPRRRRGRAQARALRPGLRDRRWPRGAGADPADRRAARPRAAEGRRRQAAGRRLRCAGVPHRRPAAGAGRAHLFAGQPARCRLRGHRRHLQRAGQAQLLPADLLRRRAQRRHERRPGARRAGARGRRQRGAPGRRRAGELPGAGELRACAAGARPRRGADQAAPPTAWSPSS